MPIYRYNVVVDVDITTNSQQGKRDLERGVRDAERIQKQSIDRIAKEEQSLHVMRTRQAQELTGYHSQVAAANRNYHIERFRQQKAEFEQAETNRRASLQATQAHNTRLLAEQQKFATRFAQLDPFSRLSTNNIPLGQTSQYLNPLNLNPNQIRQQTAQQAQANQNVLKYAAAQQQQGMAGLQNALSGGPLQNTANAMNTVGNAARQNAGALQMWGNAFKGAFVGAIAGLSFSLLISGLFEIARGIASIGVESVVSAAKLETQINALRVFEGSAFKAGERLREVDEIARNTAGLRMETAEKGYVQLRALGFEAEQAKAFIKELGEEKILSGASNEALERVVFNFSQIASGGQKVSQELREIFTQMPSLRRAFFETFKTLDPQKIQSFFDKDTNQAFKMLTDTMARQKAAVGGLEDAWGKLGDATVGAMRLLGQPVLAPLTNDVRDLTRWLNESRTELTAIGFGLRELYNFVAAGSLPGMLRSTGIDLTDVLLGPSGSPLRILWDRAMKNSPYQRARRQVADDTALEAESTYMEQVYQAQQAEMRDRARQGRMLGTYQSGITAEREAAQKIALAKVKGNVEAEFKLRQEGFAKAIAETRDFYQERINLAAGNDEAVIQLTIERDIKIRDLETQAYVDRIENERQMLERQRQTTDQWYGLMIRDREQYFTKLVRYSDNYDTALNATKEYFAELEQLTRGKYANLLTDTKLTADERRNVEQQLQLELTDLKTRELDQTIQLEDRKREAELRTLEFRRNAAREYAQFYSGFAGQFSSVFDPAGYNSQSLRVFRAGALRGDQIGSLNSRLDMANSAAEALKSDPSKTGDAYFTAFKKINDEITDLTLNLAKVKASVPEAYQRFAQLAETVGADYTAFDKLNQAILRHQQILDRTEAESELDYWQGQVELFKKLSDSATDLERKESFMGRLQEAQLNLGRAERSLTKLDFDQAKQSADAFRESLSGIRQDIEALESQDPQYRGALKYLFEKGQADTVRSTLVEIYRTELLLSGDDITAGYRRRLEVLQHIAEIREREYEALTRIDKAKIDIQMQGVFSQNRADADLYEFFAGQKGLTEIFSDARVQTVTTAYSALDNVIGKLTKRFGMFGDVIKSVLSDLIKLTFNRIFMKMLFGGNASASGVGGIMMSGGGGGIMSAGSPGVQGIMGPAMGTLLSGFSGPMMMGPQGVPIPADGTYSATRPRVVGQDQGNGQVVAGTQGAAMSALTSGNFLKGLQASAPFLGLSMGTMFGGSSGAGQLLGAAGGGLLGLVGGAFGSSSTAFGGLFGSIGGFLGISGAATLGIGAAIGGALMLGAWLLGRNAARRRDERTRNSAMIDALGSLDKLIEGVKKDRIDGESALSQADEIRKNYVDNMTQLKDKKTRGIALRDVSRLDAKITELKAAVAEQTSRRERLALLVPTFADGGATSGFYKRYASNPLGYQYGGGNGRADDNLGWFPAAGRHARYSDTEYILDAETTRNVGVATLDNIRATKGKSLRRMQERVFRNAPRHAAGGSVLSVPDSNTSVGAGDGITIEIHVVNQLGTEQFTEVVKTVVRGNDGSEEQFAAMAKAIQTVGTNSFVAQLSRKIGS